MAVALGCGAGGAAAWKAGLGSGRTVSALALLQDSLRPTSSCSLPCGDAELSGGRSSPRGMGVKPVVCEL